MRYAPFMTAGDQTIKSHVPDLLRCNNGGSSWKQAMSGLRPMSGWRAEQVERELQMVAERRQGA